MTVNNALNYYKLKYIIRSDETQDKAANYQENINFKTHFNEVFLLCYLVSVFFLLLISGIGLK